MGSPRGKARPAPPPGAAARLARARRLVLYALLALGACTVATAVALVLHALDAPGGGGAGTLVVWGGGAGAPRGGGGRAGAPRPPGAAGRGPGPVSKEMDPDYVDARAAAAAAAAAKKCTPGCELRGNCNAEEGRCECPFGYYGPLCNKEMFPACKMAANATEMHCGDRMPRSCECLRQCRAFFCPNRGKCETPRDPWFVRCFERLVPAGGGAKGGGGGGKRVARGAVYSDVPSEAEERGGGVRWFRGIRDDLQREGLTRQQATAVKALAQGEADMVALPLARCPASCMWRGQCVKAATAAPRCLCWQGYAGEQCEQVHKASCLNQCLGRGVCRGGFCHCQPGFWGRDCSRARAYAPHNAHSSVTALRVYAYELPTHLAFDMERFVGFQGHDPGYIAYKGFISGFMADWAVRTENPWEASLFYVPALSYAYSAANGDVTEHLRRVMTWVAGAHPFFNRTSGKDHFFWLPNDRGACWIDPADPLLGGPIKVTHFGYAAPDGGLPGDFALMPRRGAACHVPLRDVVAAPYFAGQEALAKETYAAFDPATVPSGRLLFFAGAINRDRPEHSGGVRQELWRLFKAGKLGPDVLISDNPKLPDFKQLARSSKFCLAPWGHGWGNTLGLYVVLGCVPVIVQDGVHQPYQDQLPYHEFSVRLPKARLPHVSAVLAAIKPAEYAALRAGLARHWPAFVWHPRAGGQAYNYTISSLRARAHNLLGGLACSGANERAEGGQQMPPLGPSGLGPPRPTGLTQVSLFTPISSYTLGAFPGAQVAVKLTVCYEVAFVALQVACHLADSRLPVSRAARIQGRHVCVACLMAFVVLWDRVIVGRDAASPPAHALGALLGVVTLNGALDGVAVGAVFGEAAVLGPTAAHALVAGTSGVMPLLAALRIVLKASLPRTLEGLRLSIVAYFCAAAGVLLVGLAAYVRVVLPAVATAARGGGGGGGRYDDELGVLPLIPTLGGGGGGGGGFSDGAGGAAAARFAHDLEAGRGAAAAAAGLGPHGAPSLARGLSLTLSLPVSMRGTPIVVKRVHTGLSPAQLRVGAAAGALDRMASLGVLESAATMPGGLGLGGRRGSVGGWGPGAALGRASMLHDALAGLQLDIPGLASAAKGGAGGGALHRAGSGALGRQGSAGSGWLAALAAAGLGTPRGGGHASPGSPAGSGGERDAWQGLDLSVHRQRAHYAPTVDSIVEGDEGDDLESGVFPPAAGRSGSLGRGASSSLTYGCDDGTSSSRSSGGGGSGSCSGSSRSGSSSAASDDASDSSGGSCDEADGGSSICTTHFASRYSDDDLSSSADANVAVVPLPRSGATAGGAGAGAGGWGWGWGAAPRPRKEEWVKQREAAHLQDWQRRQDERAREQQSAELSQQQDQQDQEQQQEQQQQQQLAEASSKERRRRRRRRRRDQQQPDQQAAPPPPPATTASPFQAPAQRREQPGGGCGRSSSRGSQQGGSGAAALQRVPTDEYCFATGVISSRPPPGQQQQQPVASPFVQLAQVPLGTGAGGGVGSPFGQLAHVPLDAGSPRSSAALGSGDADAALTICAARAPPARQGSPFDQLAHLPLDASFSCKAPLSDLSAAAGSKAPAAWPRPARAGSAHLGLTTRQLSSAASCGLAGHMLESALSKALTLAPAEPRYAHGSVWAANWRALRGNACYVLATVLTYTANYSVFPAFITFAVVPARLGSWYSLLLVATYGCGDLTGKLLPVWRPRRPQATVMAIAAARLLLFLAAFAAAVWLRAGPLVLFPLTFLLSLSAWYEAMIFSLACDGHNPDDAFIVESLLAIQLDVGIALGSALSLAWSAGPWTAGAGGGGGAVEHG
ncbi:glucuronosyltransferase [Scenedesmus sp. PABB004]|nr:glucuronosyltransferase [Scenedesmus sp. PABB004]